MYFSLLLIVTLSAAAVQADLVCLGWTLVSPLVGLVCHLAPSAFHAAENATVNAVEEAVQDLGNLAKFDVTHNPAAIAFNAVGQVKQGGFSQGGQYLKNVTSDFRDVTIGFGKGTANQVHQIMELTYWGDVSFCLTKGAGNLVAQAKRSRKRAGVPSSGAAVAMWKNCISTKLEQIANPVVLNITDPNQNIGSTISNIAGLLIPVGSEEVATGHIAQGAFDLAVPGSEDGTRILKKTIDGSVTVVEHFASEEEAFAVADEMKNPAWVEENCGMCALPLTLPAGNLKNKRYAKGYLSRRGLSTSACCKAPLTLSDAGPPVGYQWFDTGEPSDAAVTQAEVQEEGVTAQQAQEDQIADANPAIQDPVNFPVVKETDLVKPPVYQVREYGTKGMQDLRNDLNDQSTGVVGFSSSLSRQMSVKQVLQEFRQVFWEGESNEFFKLLDIQEDKTMLQMKSYSSSWIKKGDKRLGDLQKFVKAAVKDCTVATYLVGELEDPSLLNQFEGSIEFYYYPAIDAEYPADATHELHADADLLQFTAEDIPGLVIQNSATKTFSRVDLVDKGWQVLKGTQWGRPIYDFDTPATQYATFGEDMQKGGRVSMSVNIRYVSPK